MEAFQDLVQVVNKIQKIIDTKEFWPSPCHAQVFKKASLLLLGSCGYPTPSQVQNLQQKLYEHVNDSRILSNEKLTKKITTLIEIAPNASFKDLDNLLTEIDSEINLKNISCKTLLFGMIDRGELFSL